MLTIDESREQTAAIQARQRRARTLEGLLAKAHSETVIATHRAAQQLLRPLAVVNPYAQSLTFATERVRLRRDHAKYLALIDAIALLHQYERPVRMAGHGERAVEYVEATVEDIALANRLAHEVLGRSLDELPPQTRRVLGQVQVLVALRAAALGCEPSVVRFTRRELREHTGLSLAQLAVHVDRLRALEYLIAHAGRNGQRFVYELAFDGPVEGADRRLPGLIDAVRIEATTANLPDSGGDLPVGCRPAAGALPATMATLETAIPAGESADLPSLVAALALDAHPALPPEDRRRKPINGAAHAP